MVKFALISLGCPKNWVDSEQAAGNLERQGFVLANVEEADAVIINTCCFIEDATREAIDTILKCAAMKKRGRFKLVVMGCLPQRYKDSLKTRIPEVDAWIGLGKTADLPDILAKIVEKPGLSSFGADVFPYREDIPRTLLTPRGYSYIKIAEGCDHRCTFCVIPRVRGRFVSRPIESILAEAKNLASRGVKEINVIAQDTSRYGEDIYGKRRLPDLLDALSLVDGISWIRILYTHPASWDENLIRVFAENEKIVKYVDIPLQHASDGILKSMGRKTTRAEIERLILALRDGIPGVAIRSTFITGFPGETGDDFRELIEFMRLFRLDRVGIFSYSREEGTPAFGLKGAVPKKVAEERRAAAMRLQKKISLELNKAFLGKEVRVLCEMKIEKPESLFLKRLFPGKKSLFSGYDRHSWIVGRTYRDAPGIDGGIYVASRGSHPEPGEFCAVKVTGVSPYDLLGEIA